MRAESGRGVVSWREPCEDDVSAAMLIFTPSEGTLTGAGTDSGGGFTLDVEAALGRCNGCVCARERAAGASAFESSRPTPMLSSASIHCLASVTDLAASTHFFCSPTHSMVKMACSDPLCKLPLTHVVASGITSSGMASCPSGR